MLSFITGPIPAFSNLPINAQFYEPSVFVISDVALGNTTTVTTTEPVNYVVGQLVRLLIPPTFGCYQLNQQQGFVLSIPSDDEVVIDIDSSQNVGAYVASAATTPAQIVAVGDINSGIISSTGINVPTTAIPGSFINISPN